MIKLFFSGDVINTSSRKQFVSESLIARIREADFAICNLEAPLLESGIAASKAGPSIKQLTTTARILRDAGFSAVSLANNHMFDFGEGGLQSTIDCCHQAGLNWFGAGSFDEAYKPLRLEFGGKKVSLIACGEAQFGFHANNSSSGVGYPWINAFGFDRYVAEQKQICDYLIILPHAGLEDSSVPLREWRSRYRELCEAGADVVIGSHPHVPQGVEQYKGKNIIYSLGNFNFDYGSYAASDNSSYSVEIRISARGAIEIEPVFHKVDLRSKLVTGPLTRPESIDLENLNRKLSDEFYEEEVYEAVKFSYLNEILPMLKSVFSLPANGWDILAWARFFSRYRRFKAAPNRNQEVLLSHLFRNESYRWVLENAIQSEDFKHKAISPK